MKKDENVFQSWDRRGVSLQFMLPALSGPMAAVEVIWQSGRRMMTSLPVWELLWPTKHAHVNCSQYILHMCSGQSFVSCPRIFPFTSFRETDLYFPAHWPGYYYKWEGNSIGWTAGSVCNLLHICPFHRGLWTRASVHPSPGSKCVYLSIHLCVFQGI